MSSCFFIGHREAPDTLLDKLSAEVERHITEYGVTDFVVGRYGGKVRQSSKEAPPGGDAHIAAPVSSV